MINSSSLWVISSSILVAAVSRNTPVGSPVSGFLSIFPPGGDSVSFPIFASLNARLFTLQTCQPESVIITGLFGATSSKSHRFGGLLSARLVVSQPCPVIQLPLGFSLVLLRTVCLISSIDRASRISKIVDESMSPYSIRCI